MWRRERHSLSVMVVNTIVWCFVFIWFILIHMVWCFVCLCIRVSFLYINMHWVHLYYVCTSLYHFLYVNVHHLYLCLVCVFVHCCIICLYQRASRCVHIYVCLICHEFIYQSAVQGWVQSLCQTVLSVVQSLFNYSLSLMFPLDSFLVQGNSWVGIV